MTSWARWSCTRRAVRIAVLVSALAGERPQLDAAALAGRRRGPPAARPLPRKGVRRRAPGRPVFHPVERLIYRGARRRSRARAAVDGLRVSLLAFSVVSVLVLYVLQRVQGALPLNPTDVVGVAAGARVQHRGQLRDQHELAELRRRVDDDPPHPDGRARRCRTSCRPPSGIAVAVALIRGLVRRRARHDRQLLGRPHARRSLRMLLPLAFVVALVLVSQGVDPELPRHRPRHTPSRARRRRSRAGRSRARRRSRSSARTAAGSLNANSAHPFENPNGITNLARDLRCSS